MLVVVTSTELLFGLSICYGVCFFLCIMGNVAIYGARIRKLQTKMMVSIIMVTDFPMVWHCACTVVDFEWK